VRKSRNLPISQSCKALGEIKTVSIWWNGTDGYRLDKILVEKRDIGPRVTSCL
jgi:hypothetical protein